MAVFATDDGNGNVRLYGATAADDGQGNVTLLVTEAEEGEVVAEDEVSLSLVDTSGYASKTELTQTAESITLAANKSIKEAVDAVEVGGRNMLLNTGKGSTTYVAVKGGNAAMSSVASWHNRDGVLTLNFAGTTGECYYRFMAPATSTNNMYEFEPGKEYTFSGKAKVTTSSGAFEKLAARSQYYVTTWHSGYVHDILTADSEDWVDFEVTQMVHKEATGCYFSLQVYYTGSWSGTVELTELKIEKGNKATDWTPAPEDMASVAEMNAAIEVTASSIRSTVSEVKSTVDNMEIGGRNLVPGTKTGSGWSGDPEFDPDTLTFSKTMTDTTGEQMIWSAPFDLEAGEEYTVSWWEKMTSNVNGIELYLIGSDYAYTQQLASMSKLGKPTEWQRFEITFTTLTGDVAPTQVRLRFDHNASSDGNEATIYVKHAQVEKGNRATDWTPAFEDIIGEMDAKVGELSDEVKEDLGTLNGGLADVNTALGEVREAQNDLLTVATWEEYKTQQETTSTAVNTAFTSEITKLRSDLTTEVETRSGLIRMAMEGLRDEDEAGVEIGVSDSELSSVFTNKRLAFMRNSVDIITVSAEKEELEIKSAEIKEELKLGGFQWASRTNGNMGLAWIGGDE